MPRPFKLIKNKTNKNRNHVPACFTLPHAHQSQAFHSRLPMYYHTPLVSLPDTAKTLGLGSVYIKDESHRFGLNAFKVLGGSDAIGNYLAERLGMKRSDLTYERLV